MAENVLRVDGKVIERKPGYVQLGDTLGAYRNTRLGFQLETTGAWDGRLTWNGGTLERLGPRSRRTLRFDEGNPTPYYMPGHETSDWFDGGLQGMDMCGIAGRYADYDRVTARTPIFGLIDIVTGKPRALASIALPEIGVYSLERVGPTSILPELGQPDEVPYNGQHDLRRRRWSILLTDDEFTKRDKESIARDMALAWSRALADVIFKEPKGQGSPRVGREWAFVAMAAVDAGNTTLMERMAKIAAHVQGPYGNLQVNSGGNPAPPPGKWFSDAEAHYQTVALMALGMKRQAAKLADVSVANGRKGKYLEVGTGRGSPLSDGGPTDGTSWAAMACGVYGRDKVREVSGLWKVGPDYNGALHGPYTDPVALAAKIDWWNNPGKSAWVRKYLP